MQYNNQQIQALEAIKDFLKADNPGKLFVLKGSAGTGKTTVMKEIAGTMAGNFDRVIMAAPTNKAAKVLNKKTGVPAKTLHSILYQAEPSKDGYGIKLVKRRINTGEPVLFIVDESSMISDRVTASKTVSSDTPLLSDLIAYMLAGNENNKILFTGDSCQLPPMGYQNFEPSPALLPEYFSKKFDLTAKSFELTETVRQKEGSYILKGAQLLRKSIQADNHINFFYKINLSGPAAALKQYMRYYDNTRDEAVMLIASTNKNVNWWNNAVREQIGYAANKPEIGDKIVADRCWMHDQYIVSNGDTGSIFEVDAGIETFGGIRFVKAKLLFEDIAEEPIVIETLLNLDHLYSEKGLLTEEQENLLTHEAMKYNPTYRSSRDIRDDRYLNAIRLRYAYALTCHKAQGSEYDNVILHPYYGQDKAINLRYLYTAVTRAKHQLYSYEMKAFNY